MNNSLDLATDQIKKDIKQYPVLLYMKGTRFAPQCGFSSQVVQVLTSLGVAYETRDVLQDEFMRQAIKVFSDWPTIPQLYINGDFIGGCDIIMDMYADGTLAKQLS